jgi:hypothetical protein
LRTVIRERDIGGLISHRAVEIEPVYPVRAERSTGVGVHFKVEFDQVPVPIPERIPPCSDIHMIHIGSYYELILGSTLAVIIHLTPVGDIVVSPIHVWVNPGHSDWHVINIPKVIPWGGCALMVLEMKPFMLGSSIPLCLRFPMKRFLKLDVVSDPDLAIGRSQNLTDLCVRISKLRSATLVPKRQPFPRPPVRIARANVEVVIPRI